MAYQKKGELEPNHTIINRLRSAKYKKVSCKIFYFQGFDLWDIVLAICIHKSLQDLLNGKVSRKLKSIFFVCFLLVLLSRSRRWTTRTFIPAFFFHFSSSKQISSFFLYFYESSESQLKTHEKTMSESF
jgi:hypothetical protein